MDLKDKLCKFCYLRDWVSQKYNKKSCFINCECKEKNKSLPQRKIYNIPKPRLVYWPQSDQLALSSLAE